MRFILASSSPQRKQILQKLGVDFKVVPSNIDEHHNGLKRPHAIAQYLAFQKAETVAKKYPNEWVLGCDTLVVLSNGEIACKPKNRADAKRTIKLYRDSYCDVYSGLALVNRLSNNSLAESRTKKFIQHEKTRLYFRNFSNKNIEEYLNSNEWQNRSGSMTIEGKGGKWVKKIEGDYWNVVGLPVGLLKEFFKGLRIKFF